MDKTKINMHGIIVFLRTHGITDLRREQLLDISEQILKTGKNFYCSNGNERISFKLSQTQFSSDNEIIKVARLNYGIAEYLNKKEEYRKALFAPVSNAKEEEFVLYYEGEKQKISGGPDMYPYFKSKGFKVVENTHPSILINTISLFTDERLKELGIPDDVDIEFPTKEESLLPSDTEPEAMAYFRICRHGSGNNSLCLSGFHCGSFNGTSAIILQKI